MRLEAMRISELGSDSQSPVEVPEVRAEVMAARRP